MSDKFTLSQVRDIFVDEIRKINTYIKSMICINSFTVFLLGFISILAYMILGAFVVASVLSPVITIPFFIITSAYFIVLLISVVVEMDMQRDYGKDYKSRYE